MKRTIYQIVRYLLLNFHTLYENIFICYSQAFLYKVPCQLSQFITHMRAFNVSNLFERWDYATQIFQQNHSR